MARGRIQGRWTKARSAAVMSTTDNRTSDTLALFAGNANPALAQDIAKGLQAPLGRIYVGRFSDGEINIELMENVRGRDVFIVQSTCPPANESKVMNSIGEVEGKTCILIDDLVDTAGTLCQAAQALKEEGAVKVVGYITHPVLSGGAVEKVMKSALDELVVTDTIPLGPEARGAARIRQLSVAELLAETIRRILDEESVSSLYVD